jgi:hypothetical protein
MYSILSKTKIFFNKIKKIFSINLNKYENMENIDEKKTICNIEYKDKKRIFFKY